MRGAEATEQRIIVVGAGIIGICCALALRENGFAVTVLDKDGPGEATSFGAAGNLGNCRGCCSIRSIRCRCAGAICRN